MKGMLGELILFSKHSNDELNMKTLPFPGGVLSMTWGQMIYLSEINSYKMNDRGRHSIFLNGKRIRVMVVSCWRIPNGSKDSLLKYKNQCNKKIEKIKIVKYYREELLNNIKKEIKSSKNISNMIIAGDFNENVAGKRMKKFLLKNGLYVIF